MQEISSRILPILRAARKRAGYTQESLSKRLGLHQSAYSRIESGSQNISAEEWFEFCRLTETPVESALTGFIDRATPISLKTSTQGEPFKIPERYSNLRASANRTLLPFGAYFNKKFKKNNIQKFLSSLKFDPDFFIHLDNQVNINLFLDIARELIRKGHLKPEHLEALAAPISDPEIQGKLYERYIGLHSPSVLLNLLVSNAKIYEANFDYAIIDENKTHLTMSVTPFEHLKEFNYRSDPELGDFGCRYKIAYFSRFVSAGSKRPVKLKHLHACHFKSAKAEKCVYQIQI